MINLLSTPQQHIYRAARLNLKLRSYLLLSLALFAVIAAIFGGGLYLTLVDRSAAESLYQERKQSLAEYDSVKAEAESFASDLKIAKSILSQEVRYSDLIVKVSQTLPADAVLNSLILDKTTLAKPLTLSARVASKGDAVPLKATLESSPLFDGVNINSVIEEQIGEGELNPMRVKYPVSVTLSMNVTKGQPGSLLP